DREIVRYMSGRRGLYAEICLAPGYQRDLIGHLWSTKLSRCRYSRLRPQPPDHPPLRLGGFKRMVQSPDQAHYRMIAKRVLDGAVVTFLGAGVNLCGQPESGVWAQGRHLPSGAQLTEPLADQFGFPDTKERTNLLRVSEYIDVM